MKPTCTVLSDQNVQTLKLFTDSKKMKKVILCKKKFIEKKTKGQTWHKKYHAKIVSNSRQNDFFFYELF